MLRNIFRQSFWAVFVPLLLAAGLFWMDELRGYRAETSLLVLPKTEIGRGAAGNLAALAREVPFARAVYDLDGAIENPFVGKTPAERRAIWKKTAEVRLVSGSDVIHISARGSDWDDSLVLTKAIVTELVRTGSRYYNQKTDVDIRIVEEPVVIPSFTAWPRFLTYIIGTALFFTVLFFMVYGLIDRLFPKRRVSHPTNGEYVISPDTFKPRVPAYWGHEEPTSPVEAEAPATLEVAEWPSESVQETEAQRPKFETETIAPIGEPSINTIESEAPAWVEREPEPEVEFSEEKVSAFENAEVSVDVPAIEQAAGDAAPVYAGYVSHAAAPDNLPIVDTPLTPLQGAQARLMKEDIDATAAAFSAHAESALPEEVQKPQTHEPTQDEYRRRLNELLSGKM